MKGFAGILQKVLQKFLRKVLRKVFPKVFWNGLRKAVPEGYAEDFSGRFDPEGSEVAI